MDHTYIAIDLKSYYASVECKQRKLDPLTTNLVVADSSRTEKTICLAVSPSLKAYGISGRARLFEVVQRVKEVNRERLSTAIRHGLQKSDDGKYHFVSASFLDDDLKSDPSLELSYIVAPPQMELYEKISTQIYSVYSKYIAPEDIHVYSIDECFIDATNYLKTYRLSAQELAITMIRDVLYTTGITATAGIGTNLYLAKIAMDIVAKHAQPDKDGVRMAELNEQSYRDLLWCHKPLTDFWRVGKGIAKRMNDIGCYTMGDIAVQSVTNETPIYNALGKNAELLIDHAWGWEPTEIKDIKSYKPNSSSLSSGQVLMEPYTYDKAKLIVREMTELLALDLVRKGKVTKKVDLTIGYDRESIQYAYEGKSLKDSTFTIKNRKPYTGEVVLGCTSTAVDDANGKPYMGEVVLGCTSTAVDDASGKPYTGEVIYDPYKRPVPKPAHGSQKLDKWTSSARKLIDGMIEVYEREVDKDLLIRRVTIVACDLIDENEIPEEGGGQFGEQLSLFVDYEELERKEKTEKKALDREKRIQKATLAIQEKYGKNSLLKAMNLQEGATTKMRNDQIGGHKK